MPYEFVYRREGDLPYSVADNSLARDLLNWNPKRNIYEMCADSWRWFKNKLSVMEMEDNKFN